MVVVIIVYKLLILILGGCTRTATIEFVQLCRLSMWLVIVLISLAVGVWVKRFLWRSCKNQQKIVTRGLGVIALKHNKLTFELFKALVMTYRLKLARVLNNNFEREAAERIELTLLTLEGSVSYLVYRLWWLMAIVHCG